MIGKVVVITVGMVVVMAAVVVVVVVVTVVVCREGGNSVVVPVPCVVTKMVRNVDLRSTVGVVFSVVTFRPVVDVCSLRDVVDGVDVLCLSLL